jgi:hypothetical protein
MILGLFRKLQGFKSAYVGVHLTEIGEFQRFINLPLGHNASGRLLTILTTTSNILESYYVAARYLYERQVGKYEAEN